MLIFAIWWYKYSILIWLSKNILVIVERSNDLEGKSARFYTEIIKKFLSHIIFVASDFYTDVAIFQIIKNFNYFHMHSFIHSFVRFAFWIKNMFHIVFFYYGMRLMYNQKKTTYNMEMQLMEICNWNAVQRDT